MYDKQLTIDLYPSSIIPGENGISVNILWGYNLMREARRVLSLGNCVYVIGHFTKQGGIQADKIRIIYANGANNTNTGYLIEGGRITAPEPIEEVDF